GPWFLRQERCYLIPGDSALGLRLPLDSLPWAAAGDLSYVHQPDLTQAFQPLAPYADIRQKLRGESTAAAEKAAAERLAEAPRRAAVDPTRHPQPQESAGWISRTAMCAEARNGVLYIFMPPAGRLEDYLELVTAVEATAANLSQPVVMEGYEPPRDPRLNSFR